MTMTGDITTFGNYVLRIDCNKAEGGFIMYEVKRVELYCCSIRFLIGTKDLSERNFF